ncbi:hypothetical protein D3C87_1712740 [compost metagenome]
MIFEGAPEQHRIAVEIAVSADFCPGGIDAERNDRQQHVDDPDAKILFSATGKRQAVEIVRYPLRQRPLHRHRLGHDHDKTSLNETSLRLPVVRQAPRCDRMASFVNPANCGYPPG